MDQLLENPKAIRVGGEDIAYKGGREIERGEVPVKAGSGAGAGGLKSADESLMYKQAAAYFGGFVDPVTGKMSGILQNDVPMAQAIVSEATRIYREKGSISKSEAVELAAEKYGVKIPAQVGQANPQDPAGIRNYLLQN